MLLSLAQPARPGPPPASLPSTHTRPAVPPIEVAHPVGRQRGISAAWSGLATGTRWPLVVVLAVQSVLTLRLTWSNTAFSDEALYLWAGRLELAHLLHGGPVPAFATYFSGAPVLYPPVGAAAAAVGGLAAARLLSLAFMLGTTALLHGLTRRIFDRRAAFLAAAVYAGLAGTQFLGALATYDAMALWLLALAAWLAVVTADCCGEPAAAVAVAAGAAVALANATKYATGLYDPVVLSIGILSMWRSRGRVAARRAGLIMLGTGAVLVLAALLIAGRPYLRGLAVTTIGRHSGSFPAPGILLLSGKWLWPVATLALLGVLAAVTAGRDAPFATLVAVLAVAVLLAPLEQARLHTDTSLFKHDDYGAWFGCAVAGYALAALSRVVPQVNAIAAFRAGVVMTAAAALPAIPAAGQQYSWPNSAALMAQLPRIIAAYPGPILADDGGDLLHFYLGRQVSTMPVVGTWYISYRRPGAARPQTGLAGYAEAIANRYFGVVLLEFTDNLTMDYRIERLVALSGRYRPVVSIPYPVPGGTRELMVWVRQGSQ